VAYAMKLAPTMRPDQHLLVNLSGRGDKDIGTVADLSGADFYCRPSCRGQGVKGGMASGPSQPVTLTRPTVASRSEVKGEDRAQPGTEDMSEGGQPSAASRDAQAQRRPESATGSQA